MAIQAVASTNGVIPQNFRSWWAPTYLASSMQLVAGITPDSWRVMLISKEKTRNQMGCPPATRTCPGSSPKVLRTYLSPSSVVLGYLANRVVANNTCVRIGDLVCLESSNCTRLILDLNLVQLCSFSTRFGPRRDETVSRSGVDKAREASSG